MCIKIETLDQHFNRELYLGEAVWLDGFLYEVTETIGDYYRLVEIGVPDDYTRY